MNIHRETIVNGANSKAFRCSTLIKPKSPSTSTIKSRSRTSPSSSIKSKSPLPKSVNKSKTSPSSTRTKKAQYFSVDEILGCRKFGDKIEYLLKWKGYPDQYNSWEIVANITEDLIVEYEYYTPALRILSSKRVEAVMLKDTPIKIWDVRKTTDGKMEYFVEWQTDPDFDWVPGDILKEAFPELVIEFYERISRFVD